MLVLAVISLLTLRAGAEEQTLAQLPSEYTEMMDGLPDTLREALPEEVFTADAEGAAQAWQALLSPHALLDLIFESVGKDWSRYLGLLMQLLGVLLVRAVWSCLSQGVRSPALTGSVQLLCRLTLFGIISAQALQLLEGVVLFYQQLNALTTGLVPLMGAMYAMGGNVSTAIVNQSTLVLSMSLIEWIGGQTVVPLFSLCLAFALLGAWESTVAGRMQILTGKLKKWYTTGISLVMLVLSSLLGAQTVLTARADSLGFRTVRFAVSSTIPMVGGGVADMLRTAATAVSWLRGVVGVGGIVLLLWLLLPQIISLLLSRWTFTVASDIAQWFGCGEEGRLLGEIGSLQGYLLAVISVSVMTFFFALVLLLKCGAAYA